jgi:hypothetical protein
MRALFCRSWPPAVAFAPCRDLPVAEAYPLYSLTGTRPGLTELQQSENISARPQADDTNTSKTLQSVVVSIRWEVPSTIL